MALLRDGIKIVPLVKGLTPQKATKRQPAAPESAILLNGLHRVLGTRGAEAAAGRERGRNMPLIKPNESEQKPFHVLSDASSIRCSFRARER